MKRLYFLMALCLAVLCATAQNGTPGQWRLHNTWDYYPDKCVDTPGRTFFLNMGTFNYPAAGWTDPRSMLFARDKATGEMTEMNAANYLHGNIVQCMAYNPAKGYLMLVYDDGLIDLLYDDDTLVTVPGLSTAQLNSEKKVNSITFDPAGDRADLATAFGYVAVDDKNGVIAESRVYDMPLTSVARVGDRLLAASGQGIFASPLQDRHSTWASFSPVEGLQGNGLGLMPLDDGKCFVLCDGIKLAEFPEAWDGAPQIKEVNQVTAAPMQFFANKDGYLLDYAWFFYQIKADGSYKVIDKPEARRSLYGASWDGSNFAFNLARAGLELQRYDKDGKTWTVTGAETPRALQPYRVFHLTYSPRYGMTAANETFNRLIDDWWVDYRQLISMWDGTGWSSVGGSVYSDSPFQNNHRSGYGISYDPIDPDVIWAGSFQGLFKLNVAEKNIELLSRQGGPGQGKPGFTAVFPTVSAMTKCCWVTAPSFDTDGTLWTAQTTSSPTPNDYNALYYWKAADRAAGNTDAIKSIPIKEYKTFYNAAWATALTHPSNRGIILLRNACQWGGGFYVFSHGGTLEDTSDDKCVHMERFIDQNGTEIPSVYLNCFYEDPATGLVWVGMSTGTFYFRPSDVLAGNTRVHRAIVNRNDGSGQGDYLLNGSDVMNINADGAGRKWFATNGGGVMVTNASGNEIVMHLTAENSLLPSDKVYVTAFDPTSNAVWIGTDHQLATYYSDVTPGAADYKEVVSYPNPVRPDYYGHVTIQGLMDGSLVKITDQAGNLVRELGRSQGGMLTWDLLDLQGRRVSTGVYFIMASTESEGTSAAGKILVVR